MIKKERLVALTQKVIRINSENPPGREKVLASFIDQDMRSLGLKVKTYSYALGRPNVIATLSGSWPRVRAQREAVLITPHMDTVPIGGGWKFDPLGGQIHQGKIYGRGASDDKANLAAALEVMRSLAEDQYRPRRDLIMAATVDEETGSKAGIVPLLSRGVLKPKVALILDSDEAQAIIAQKGLIHLRVRIQGRKAHGAYNWKGINAIEQAVRVIQEIKRHRFPFEPHALLRPPTVNVGVIKGGDKVNMVADFCEFALDIRFLPGMKAPAIIATIKAIVRKVTKRFQLVVDDLQEPYEISAEHPFVKTYLRTARESGLRCRAKGSEGATVITFFKRQGIPAFASGYGARGTAHTTDEYARVDMLYQGTCLLEKFLRAYDQGEG